MAKAQQAGELLHGYEVLLIVSHSSFARSWCSDQGIVSVLCQWSNILPLGLFMPVFWIWPILYAEQMSAVMDGWRGGEQPTEINCKMLLIRRSFVAVARC